MCFPTYVWNEHSNGRLLILSLSLASPHLLKETGKNKLPFTHTYCFTSLRMDSNNNNIIVKESTISIKKHVFSFRFFDLIGSKTYTLNHAEKNVAAAEYINMFPASLPCRYRINCFHQWLNMLFYADIYSAVQVAIGFKSRHLRFIGHTMVEFIYISTALCAGGMQASVPECFHKCAVIHLPDCTSTCF